MKTKLFILLLLFGMSQTANSQNWAPIGAKWHYGYLQSIFTPDRGYYLFESAKDTVVQGHNCKKILRKDFILYLR